MSLELLCYWCAKNVHLLNLEGSSGFAPYSELSVNTAKLSFVTHYEDLHRLLIPNTCGTRAPDAGPFFHFSLPGICLSHQTKLLFSLVRTLAYSFTQEERRILPVSKKLRYSKLFVNFLWIAVLATNSYYQPTKDVCLVLKTPSTTTKKDPNKVKVIRFHCLN